MSSPNKITDTIRVGLTLGPLGVMATGSGQPNNFGQADLDLLSQIGTQIALAVDNAIAYGSVTKARDCLDEECLYVESKIRSGYNFEDIAGKSASLRKVLDSGLDCAAHTLPYRLKANYSATKMALSPALMQKKGRFERKTLFTA